MAAMCANCPFAEAGPGRELRRSLRPGRWRGILADLLRGGHFMCHKTTRETGDGSNRLCAGALEFQAEAGISSNLQRVCERLDALHHEEGR